MHGKIIYLVVAELDGETAALDDLQVPGHCLEHLVLSLPAIHYRKTKSIPYFLKKKKYSFIQPLDEPPVYPADEGPETFRVEVVCHHQGEEDREVLV